MVQSLVTLVKNRYLECVRQVQPANRWKILVLDELTQAHMGAVLKMYDILDEGVQQVELLSNARNASPRLEAVYILTPSSSNISRIIKDFEPARPAQPATKKAPAQPATPGPKYAAAHCFFIDVLNDAECDRLASSPAGQALKTLKEIYVNFWPLEAQVFSMKFNQAFWSLYGPNQVIQADAAKAWEADLDFISSSLVNICATLNEFPDIRFYAPSGCNRPVIGPTKQHPTVVLAQKVYAGLVDYAKNNEGFGQDTESSRPKGVLFITDRTMDLVAPLLHEFTYQAMCNDLLSIKDGSKYHHSFRNEKGEMEEQDAVLNDDDKVWVEIRHMHMKESLDRLVEEFRQFTSDSNQGTSLNDLKDMLASLPGMKETKEKLSLHLSLAEQCMDLFERKKLPLSANVEQLCATGTTSDGKPPKTLVEEMIPLLDDKALSMADRVRMIALYIMHRDGVTAEDLKRLFQHARLGPPEIDALSNLKYLGPEMTKESKKRIKPAIKQTALEDAYDISRYQPVMKLMVEDHFAGKLDKQAFPFVGTPSQGAGAAPGSKNEAQRASMNQPTSLRSARPRWTAGVAPKSSNEPKQRVIVFVAGGMTYSEIRSAYTISQNLNKDVYIGSTHVNTPDGFVSDLSNIEKGPAKKRPSKPSTPAQEIEQPNLVRPDLGGRSASSYGQSAIPPVQPQMAPRQPSDSRMQPPQQLAPPQHAPHRGQTGPSPYSQPTYDQSGRSMQHAATYNGSAGGRRPSPQNSVSSFKSMESRNSTQAPPGAEKKEKKSLFGLGKKK